MKEIEKNKLNLVGDNGIKEVNGGMPHHEEEVIVISGDNIVNIEKEFDDGGDAWKLVKGGNVPQDGVKAGHQNNDDLWCVVAHTNQGDIPGKGKDDTCWYPYGGKEESTKNFSWVVVAHGWELVNGDAPPQNGLPVGYQNDGAGTLWAAVAHTSYGNIPGKAKDNSCWYSYDGKEEISNDFSWVVVSGSLDEKEGVNGHHLNNRVGKDDESDESNEGNVKVETSKITENTVSMNDPKSMDKLEETTKKEDIKTNACSKSITGATKRNKRNPAITNERSYQS